MTTSLTKYQPGSLAELERFAEKIASSQFAPKGFQGKPADCMIAMALGAELGLAPLQALQNVAVVNGKPSIYGDAVLALVRGSGLCEYFTEALSADGQVATATTKRKGEAKEETRKFSIDDAKKAGLWGKQGPWSQYPARMLQMRARGFLARDVYADVLKGLITREEAEDYPAERPVDATITTPAAPQEPAAPVVMASADDQKSIMELVSALGWSGPHASNWLKKHFGCASRAQLTSEQAPKVVADLAKLLEEKEKEKPAEVVMDFTTNISGNSIGNPYNGMKEAK